jgi:hypothetical protein
MCCCDVFQQVLSYFYFQNLILAYSLAQIPCTRMYLITDSRVKMEKKQGGGVTQDNIRTQ